MVVPERPNPPSSSCSSSSWKEPRRDRLGTFAALPLAMSLPQQILQLEAYQHTPSLPEELTTLLYDTRQALRADPYLKSVLRLSPVDEADEPDLAGRPMAPTRCFGTSWRGFGTVTLLCLSLVTRLSSVLSLPWLRFSPASALRLPGTRWLRCRSNSIAKSA